MKIKSLVLSALAVFAIGSAQAAVGQANTWTLQGVTFDDGGTASGTFSVDSSAKVTSIDITTTAGKIPGSHYISTTGSIGPRDINTFTTQVGNYYLGFFFLDAMNSSATNIQIEDGNEYSYDGNEYSTSRIINGGSVITAVAAVPEPETYAMLLAGLGALGFVARRRKSL